MTKPALSVHINTAQKRKDHAASDRLVSIAREITSTKQISGYAIVTWSKNCESIKTAYDTGDAMPDMVLPEFVKSILTHRVHGDRR